MKKITTFLFLSFLILNIFSCDNDDFNSNPNNNPNVSSNDLLFQSENFGDLTTGNFFGVIKDEDGLLLEDVQITVGNSVTLTDRNGVFTINNAEVFENFAYIKAFKAGYINGSRVVIPKGEGSNRIDIVLYKNETDAVINTGQNTSVNISGGLKINFIGGDFIGEDGNPYNGPVEIVANYLRPNGIDTFTNMPGSLFAQTESYNAVNLQTYGMVSVDLFSPSGEALNIAEDSPVTIEYPIHFSQVDSAPETIDLWYFDEEVGYWKAEGQATKVDDKYVANVEHFTWWNIDAPFDPINICFNLNSPNSDGSTPYYTRITRGNNQVIYAGTIISDSIPECGVVPANEQLTVFVYTVGGTCGYELVYEEALGSFSSDASVDITITAFEEEEILTTQITGMVNNCNGEPLSNGYIYIDDDNIFNITDGNVNIVFPHCFETTTILQIYDNDTGQWNLIYDVPLNGTEYNLGAVNTCGSAGGIFNGDIIISSQQELEDFGALGYTTVIGNLSIGGYQTATDVNNLTPLLVLENVVGELRIDDNPLLTTLDGLNNVEFVSKLIIRINPSLTGLTGLSNLNSVVDIVISDNNAITSLQGLEGLTSVNRFNIHRNDLLTSLTGLESLNNAYWISIFGNNSLESISSLSNLSSADRILLNNLPSISTLDGITHLSEMEWLQLSFLDQFTDFSELSNLTSVDFINIAGNQSLVSLDGFENLINNEGLAIGINLDFDEFNDSPNPNLTDFCALENLFINGTYIEPIIDPFLPFIGITIDNNAFNPTVQDIINGNCSQ